MFITWGALVNRASIQLIEAALLLPSAGYILFRRPNWPPRLLRIEKAFRQIAHHKSMSTVAVGAAAIVLRAIVIPILKIPLPATHDEFSYLLAGDTFAHGRWTNPPHPMWIHFETYHVLQHPTYMSMYMPGQGLILALGQLLGHPWIGVLLTTGLMCSAICWMLQAWVPPEWALFGGLLAVLRLGILSYWANTYWGGSLAAFGGALVLGALPRIKRTCRVRDSLLMAAGVVILANTRPYEGFIFGLTIAAGMLPWLMRKFQTVPRLTLARFVAPMATFLVLGGAVTSYYLFRVTGSAFELPQLLNRSTYSRSKYFVWQEPRPAPVYHHAIMEKFYNMELQYFQEGRTIAGFVRHEAEKVELFWLFFLGPAFTIPLLSFPQVVSDRRMRFPLFAGAVFIMGLVVEVWTAPHYIAPATGLLYLVLVQCLRHLRLWEWKQRPVGAALVWSVPVLFCVMITIRLAAVVAGARIENPWPRGNLARAQIEHTLENTEGEQLVLVRYSELHSPLDEWVYNLSDIDRQKVVWARDLGAADNHELLEYYANRKAWLLEPDESPVKLVPIEN